MNNSKRRPGFMLYYKDFEGIEEFSVEECGMLMLAILEYATTGESPSFSDRGMRQLWRRIRETLDRDGERYAEKCEANRLRGQYKAYIDRTDVPVSFEQWRRAQLADAADRADGTAPASSACQDKPNSPGEGTPAQADASERFPALADASQLQAQAQQQTQSQLQPEGPQRLAQPQAKPNEEEDIAALVKSVREDARRIACAKAAQKSAAPPGRSYRQSRRG